MSLWPSLKLSQGDADGALKALAPIPKDRADDLGVVFLKINIFTQKRDLAQVEALLRRLVELHPDDCRNSARNWFSSTSATSGRMMR